MSTQERLENRLTAIKIWMEGNYHLKSMDNNQEVWDHYLRIVRYWGVLSKEQKEFIEKVKSSLLNRTAWR